MKLSEFDYDLPESYIAQEPAEPRDTSKLMSLNRKTQSITHHQFKDLPSFLNEGDVLVMNTTRVIPARLFGHKVATGGKLEILLLKKLDKNQWQVLIGGRRAVEGVIIGFDNHNIQAKVISVLDGPERIIQFTEPVENILYQSGELPLPPYIHQRVTDPERYQTIYSEQEGSSAAPTAGLHFTPELLQILQNKGIKLAYCTLHIGLDTFQPVKVDDIEKHHIHSERAILPQETADIINQAKARGNRVIAVGTTTTRTLETAGILSAGGKPESLEKLINTDNSGQVVAFEDDTRLFIYPGYEWRVVDAMITNFHLPKSTLLMMISSFVGREFVLNAYEMAKAQNYRFFSFGDAMLIT